MTVGEKAREAWRGDEVVATCGDCAFFCLRRTVRIRPQTRKKSGFSHERDIAARQKRKLRVGSCAAIVPFWAEPEHETNYDDWPNKTEERVVMLSELDGGGCPAYRRAR